MSDKDILKVLIICAPDREPGDGIVSDVEEVLRDRFKSRVITVTDIGTLGSTYYALMPHFVVLDCSYRKVVERLDSQYEFLKNIKERPFLFIRSPYLTDEMVRNMEINRTTFLPRNASHNEIEDALCAIAEMAGFPVKKGKIFERLVQRNLHVGISIPSKGVSYSGLTTGVNKNGFGARIKAPGVSFEELSLLTGADCRITFNDPELMFMPVDGKIIRVLRSTEPGYEAFFAGSFDSHRMYFDNQELKILENLIKSQKDDSIIKQPPSGS